MEPLTLGGRKTRRGKMYRGVVTKLWGNGVAAVVAMSIVEEGDDDEEDSEVNELDDDGEEEARGTDGMSHTHACRLRERTQ